MDKSWRLTFSSSLYTVSQKTWHRTFGHIFAKYQQSVDTKHASLQHSYFAR